MNDTNTSVLIGRVVRDVDVRYTQGGMAIGTFSLAVGRRVKREGQWIDEASFFDIELLGKIAENMRQYLTQGKRIAVEGYLKQSRWKAQDGTNRSKVSIVGTTIQFLDRNEKAVEQNVEQNSDTFTEDVPWE